MFQKIVVPLDESPLAERALPIAACIARASGGALLLVRIVTPSLSGRLQSRELDLTPADIVDAEYSRAGTYLWEMAHTNELQGIEVKTEVGTHRDPAEGILTLAQTNEADLIVMGSHGLTGAFRWKLGSVARKVSHHSHIPILLVRSDTQISTLRRILVPLDGSALAEQAIEPAIFLSTAFSAPAPATLHFACVLPLSEPEVHAFTEKNQAILEAQAYLAALKRRLLQEEKNGTISISESITINTDVAHVLIEMAESGKGAENTHQYDLIAMSTHGRTGLMRWVMGSVTERVLAATRLPLFIMRPAHRHESQDAQRH